MSGTKWWGTAAVNLGYFAGGDIPSTDNQFKGGESKSTCREKYSGIREQNGQKGKGK